MAAGPFRLIATIENASDTVNLSMTPETGARVGEGCSAAVTVLAHVRTIGAGDSWELATVMNVSPNAGTHLTRLPAVTATGLYRVPINTAIGAPEFPYAHLFPNRIRALREAAGASPNISVDFYEVRADCGGLLTLVPPTPITGTIDIPIPNSGGLGERGGFKAAAFWTGLDIISASTWDISLWADSAKTVLLAAISGVSVNSTSLLSWATAFEAANTAIPFPKVLTLTNTAGATPSATIRLVMGHV